MASVDAKLLTALRGLYRQSTLQYISGLPAVDRLMDMLIAISCAHGQTVETPLARHQQH
jgi:hypothetical protein